MMAPPPGPSSSRQQPPSPSPSSSTSTSNSTSVALVPKPLQPRQPRQPLQPQQPQQPQQLAPQNAGPQRRQILPAGPPSREGISNDGALIRGGPPVRGKVVIPPKNVHVKGACDTCRTRKIKCSGGRPKCVACQRSGADCNYVAGPTETHSQALKRKFGQLQEEKSIYEELTGLIRKMPEHESTEIVRRLRAGDDVATIVRQVKTGCLLLELALSPESRFRYSFPYVKDMPVALRSPDNPYVGSSLFEASYSSSPSPRPEELPENAQCMYTKPYHVAEVVDVRFSKMRASRWTFVIDDDNLFVNLLKTYILHEHTTYPYLHIDLFLEGLATGDERFCSSLMVNTILASACHCYQALPDRHKFWKPHSLGYQFLSEARRLWELEIKAGEPTLTTITSGILLNTEYNHNGMDSLGHTFLYQSLTMADHIGLFKPEAHHRIYDKRIREMWEFCAWGLFVWSTVQTYYFYRKPLLEIPLFPLPDPRKNPSWYGEVQLLYPVSPHPIPAGHGDTIKSNADLHVILHKISIRAFYDGKRTLKLTWEEAMEFNQMLDDWFNALPTSISPKNVVFPWHLKLHTMYYTATHLIYSSLIAPDALPSIATLTSLPPDEPIVSAGEISGRAVMRLETVVRLYYLRHSFSCCDSFLVYFLSILARATLETMGTYTNKPVLDPQQMRVLRSTVLLCMKGMNEQGQNNYIAEVVYRLIKSTLPPEDLDALQSNVNLVELTEDDLFVATQCRSHWPMPGVKVYDNPRDQAVDKTLDRLVKKYNNMTLEEHSERRRREARRVEEVEDD